MVYARLSFLEGKIRRERRSGITKRGSIGEQACFSYNNELSLPPCSFSLSLRFRVNPYNNIGDQVITPVSPEMRGKYSEGVSSSTQKELCLTVVTNEITLFDRCRLIDSLNLNRYRRITGT